MTLGDESECTMSFIFMVANDKLVKVEQTGPACSLPFGPRDFGSVSRQWETDPSAYRRQNRRDDARKARSGDDRSPAAVRER